MSESMSFDDVVETSIKGGNLSEDEITEMKELLSEVRRLSYINNSDAKINRKINKLSYRFDWFAVKGMPELAAKYGVHANDYMVFTKGKHTKKLLIVLVLLISSIVTLSMVNLKS